MSSSPAPLPNGCLLVLESTGDDGSKTYRCDRLGCGWSLHPKTGERVPRRSVTFAAHPGTEPAPHDPTVGVRSARTGRVYLGPSAAFAAELMRAAELSEVEVALNESHRAGPRRHLLPPAVIASTAVKLSTLSAADAANVPDDWRAAWNSAAEPSRAHHLGADGELPEHAHLFLERKCEALQAAEEIAQQAKAIAQLEALAKGQAKTNELLEKLADGFAKVVDVLSRKDGAK